MTAFRVCLGVISVLLLVFGTIMLWSGFSSRAKCKAAEAAIPLNAYIDVGTVASHRATLNQSAAFVCRQTFQISTDLRTGETAADLLRDLELTVVVTDLQNVEVLRGVFPDPLKPMGHGENATLLDCTPLPIGEYSVVIDVTKPAPLLEGRRTHVHSRYRLCGLEWMEPTIGIGSGVLALSMGAFFAFITRTLHRQSMARSA